DDRDLRIRDSINTVALGLLHGLRDSAVDANDARGWTDAAAVYQRWAGASDSAVSARRQNRVADATRIRLGVEHPIRLQLDSAIRAGVVRATAAADRTAASGAHTASTSRMAVIVG